MTERFRRHAPRRDMLKTLAMGATVFALPRFAHAARLTLADIRKAGALRVGMALNPPMVLQTMSGGWYGFNPDLVRMLGRSLGVDIVFRGATWETIVPGLLAHKYDMIGASISATELRKKVINFSDPYFNSGQVFVINKNNPKHLSSVAALNQPSVTVAYTQSSIEGEIVHKLLPNATGRALTSSSVGDLIAEIESGRSDAFAITSALREPILAKFSWAATVPNDDTGLNPTAVAWGIRKEDTGLLDAVNGFLDKVNKDGTVAAMLKQDLTPSNAGLG